VSKPSGAESDLSNGYIAARRLRYNGYVFLGDVLEHQDEVRTLRDYTNQIGCATTERSLYQEPPEAPEGDEDRVFEEYLKKEGDRVEFLHSLDYSVGWSVPLAYLIRENRLDEYKTKLRVIEQNLPQMSMVNHAYLFDEPNFTDVTTETLERFVDAFKSVFPEVKVWFCYAIVHPKYMDVIPPRNADIMGIDPYMFTRHYRNTPADFEFFYRESLACALDWINRWDGTWFLAGDCFQAPDPARKKPPLAETASWYYQLALTQPNCIGIYWNFYGDRIEREDLIGFSLKRAPDDLKRVHRRIGEAILGQPSRLGLSWFDSPETQEAPFEQA